MDNSASVPCNVCGRLPEWRAQAWPFKLECPERHVTIINDSVELCIEDWNAVVTGRLRAKIKKAHPRINGSSIGATPDRQLSVNLLVPKKRARMLVRGHHGD